MADQPRPLTPRLRDPYVGRGVDGCLRSAAIDREERDTLPYDSPRRELLSCSAERWELQAALYEAGDVAAQLAERVARLESERDQLRAELDEIDAHFTRPGEQ
jgi:hypothetical protein